METELTFGTRVRYSQALQRRYRRGPGGGKAWTPEKCLNNNAWNGGYAQIREGIIVGKRVYSNGVAHTSYDEPPVYVPDEFITVYLVAWDIRRKLDAVRLEDLTVISDDLEPQAPVIEEVRATKRVLEELMRNNPHSFPPGMSLAGVMSRLDGHIEYLDKGPEES